MTLTSEHVEAAKRGETVRFTADEVSLVLLRADLLERVRENFNPRDAYPLVNALLREDDERDPLLASYQ